MPITVCKIENLFWSNNSYRKPNCLPKFKEVKEIKQRPIIYDFMGGRTHLYGDDWNYAVYEGIYYFLKIEKAKDVKKGHYSYILVRDLWMNILLRYNTTVRGRLATTNRDEWLEANLNRAYPVLMNPVNVTRVSLVEDQEKIAHIQGIKSTKSLFMNLLDPRDITDFRNRWIQNVQLYKQQLDWGHYVAGNSPIFIFGKLKGQRTDSTIGWKEDLRYRINQFLEDIVKNKDNLVISKVQATAGAGHLKDNYCLTWRRGGIGVGEEAVSLEKIDLSGLYDIEPYNPVTQATPAPNKAVSEDLFSNVYLTSYKLDQIKETGVFNVRKIRRKIYFPITQNTSECGIALPPRYSSGGYKDNELVRSQVTWQWACPQKLKLRNESIREIFLFWVDNVDFSLSYYYDQLWFSRGVIGSQVTIPRKEWQSALGDKYKIPYPFHSLNDDVYSWSLFSRNLITPLGFLIFKPFDAQLLNGFVWMGANTNTITYISGLKSSQIERISSGEIFKGDKYSPLPYPIKDYYSKQNESLNNDNWNRYWFNIINGLDILLQPNQSGYSYAYRTWRQNDRTSNNYSMRYLQYDQAPWPDNKAPFANEQRHKESVARAYRLIDNIAMKTTIEIPVEISNGDYVFNDLEYWLDEYDADIWGKDKSIAEEQVERSFPAFHGATVHDNSSAYNKFAEGFRKGFFSIEDFQVKPGTNSEEEVNSVVICSNREGKIELRVMSAFTRWHRLHGQVYSEDLSRTRTGVDSIEGFGGDEKQLQEALTYEANDITQGEQAVESVDGATAKSVGYIVLKKLERAEIEQTNQPMEDKLVNLAIAQYLKSNGYKVSHDSRNVLFYDRRDLEGATDLFFDLKGTDWYAHIKQGRITLIAKKPTLFSSVETKLMKLGKSPELNELSTIEKINQKCVLNIHTQQRLLKTRFLFDDDRMDLSVKSIKPTHKKNPVNYFYVNLRSDFDVMEREVIEVLKNELDEQATIVDYAQLETLRAQMRRNDRDYEINVARDVVFATEKENEEYRRRQYDLSMERMQMWLNTGTGLSNLALFSSGFAGGLFAAPATTTRTTSTIKANAKVPGEPYLTTNTRIHTASKSAMATKFGAWGANMSRTIGGGVIGQQIFNESANRIDIDRAFAFKDIAFRSLTIDLRHRDMQEDNIRRLNQMSHVYNKGTINDIAIVDQFNKENNLGSINLTVFTPSTEQMKLLRAHKEEYGVDCDIMDAIVEVREGMSEDVIRFKHLKEESIKGITNSVERGYLAGALEMGVRVVSNCDAGEQRRKEETLTCVNVYNLAKEIDRHRTASGSAAKVQAELRDQITKLTEQLKNKEQEIKGLEGARVDPGVIKQLESDKAALNQTINSLQEQIAQKQANIAQLQQELDNKKQEVEQCKKESKETQAEQLKQLQERINTLGGDITRLTNDINELNQVNQGLRSQLSNKERELDRLKAEKEQNKAKIGQENEEMKKLQDQIVNLNSELDRKGQEIATKANRISELTEQLEQARRQAPTAPAATAQNKKQLDEIKKQLDAKYARIVELVEADRQLPVADRIHVTEMFKNCGVKVDSYSVSDFDREWTRDRKVRTDKKQSLLWYLKNRCVGDQAYPKPIRELIALAAATPPAAPAQDIAEIQKQLTQAVNRAETLSREYKTLEQAKNDAEKLKNLYLNEKNKLHGQLEECKRNLEEAKKVKPAAPAPAGDCSIDATFPRPEGDYPVPIPNSILNSWQERGAGWPAKDAWSRYYYTIEYFEATTYKKWLYVYKPGKLISHKVLLIQNLINCLHDYRYSKDRLIDFTNREIKWYGNKHQFIRFYWNRKTVDERPESMNFSGLGLEDYDKELGNVIWNAFCRTADAIDLARPSGSDYVTPLFNILPDRTHDKIPCFILSNASETTRLIKNIIYQLRTKPWNEAYPAITDFIYDWDWLNPDKYPA